MAFWQLHFTSKTKFNPESNQSPGSENNASGRRASEFMRRGLDSEPRKLHFGLEASRVPRPFWIEAARCPRSCKDPKLDVSFLRTSCFWTLFWLGLKGNHKEHQHIFCIIFFFGGGFSRKTRRNVDLGLIIPTYQGGRGPPNVVREEIRALPTPELGRRVERSEGPPLETRSDDPRPRPNSQRGSIASLSSVSGRFRGPT